MMQRKDENKKRSIKTLKHEQRRKTFEQLNLKAIWIIYPEQHDISVQNINQDPYHQNCVLQ